MSYVLAPDGITGTVTKSIGAYVQMWPSGSVGASTEPITTYTPGDVQLAKGANQLVLWPIFTSGPSTTECDVKVECAPNLTGQWYQVPVAVSLGIGRLSYTGMEIILPSGSPVTVSVPFLSDYVRVSARVVGTPSGSLLSINATIASVM